MIGKVIITDSRNTKFVVKNETITEGEISPSVIQQALNMIACNDPPRYYEGKVSSNGNILYVKFTGEK